MRKSGIDWQHELSITPQEASRIIAIALGTFLGLLFAGAIQ